MSVQVPYAAECTGENKEHGACPMRDRCYRWRGPVSPLKRTYGLIFAPFVLELHDKEPHTMWQAECGQFVERTTANS